MIKNKKFIIYTDGGARNNPGPAGIGAVIKDEKGAVIGTISEYIGEATNNQAEYRAVLAAIKQAKQYGASELEFFLDSELVARQLSGEYKIKNKDLAPLFVKIYNESLGFKKVSYCHIPREENQEADKLVNLAIDQELKKRTISSVG